MSESNPDLSEYMTPLYFAVTEGNFNDAKKLISSGDRIDDQPVEDGYSLLHMACENENADTVRFLLTQGCAKCLNGFDYLSYTPLMWAAKLGNTEIARLLLDAGADVNANNEEKIGNTAIREATCEGNLEMVEFLLQQNADPTIPGWMQIDAVMEARLQLEANPASETRRKIYETLAHHAGGEIQQ